MVHALRAVVTALCVLTLVGCVGTTSVKVNPDVAGRIQSTRAYIVIPQDEMNAGVARSGVGDSLGLLGALIDVSIEAKRASKASLAIEPVRKGLADFDFRAEFEKKFRAAQSDLSRLKINQIEVTNEPYSMEIHNRLRAGMSQDSLLTMAVDYQLSADFRCLVVYGTVTLLQRGRDEEQYLGNFRYISAPVSSKSGDTAIKAWSDTNARLLRAALHEGINETIRMLKLDFVPKTDKDRNKVAPLGADGKLKVITIKLPRGIYKGGVTTNKLSNMASEILSKEGDRIIFRSQKTDLYTFEDHVHSSTTRERFVIQ